jgi:uncharacterized protein YlzI (FlbEa/FlbD family)
MRFVRLTDLNGHSVCICDTWVEAIRQPRIGEFTTTNVGAVLVLSSENQAVRESFEDVVRKFNVS